MPLKRSNYLKRLGTMKPSVVVPTRQMRLHVEQLEQRLVMDSAGFVHTDPVEDSDSIVGVAAIEAIDDYREAKSGMAILRIDPLTNDILPEGANQLSIKSVSETKQGATVTISEDGLRLIYTAGPEGFQAADTFYYIVLTEDGKLGKANVNIDFLNGNDEGPRRLTSNDRFSVFEDAAESELEVLHNDVGFHEGEIIAVTSPSRGGTVRIADDGGSLFYQPQTTITGSESFNYTVLRQDGEEATFRVDVRIKKPYALATHLDDAIIDFGSGAKTFDPLANDRIAGPISGTPYIASFEAPDYVGQLTLSNDAQRFVYNPAEDFIGSFSVSYTVRYGPASHQTVNGSFSVSVEPRFTAVENWFAADPNATEPIRLEVLANDPIWNISRYAKQAHYLPEPQDTTLHLVSVSAGSANGSIQISEDGSSLLYRPAEGFVGDETFTYTLEGSNGVRDSASVTVHVAPTVEDLSGVNRFANEAELEQFLIDKAVARYGRQFGSHGIRYEGQSLPYYRTYIADEFVLNAASNVAGFDADHSLSHSDTNVQELGVDEADIVETDGRYVYTFSKGRLAIVDLSEPVFPTLVSLTSFDSPFDQMYLQGERMTLLRQGHGTDNAEVVVLDISDRAAPSIVERTEIDGTIADSRAIGDVVHLVIKRDFLLPELGGEWVVEPTSPSESSANATEASEINAPPVPLFTDARSIQLVGFGQSGVWRNESLDEYLDRVRGDLIDTALPSFRSFNAVGEPTESGFLSAPTDIHKPVAGSDVLVSLLTINAGDEQAGLVAPATSFVGDSNTTVYVSSESAYVFAFDNIAAETTIFKLSLAADSTSPIVASGTIGGQLLNQFSADEHEGYLRVATTEVQTMEMESNWGRRIVQRQRINNLFVLEQTGNSLTKVGEVTNLAPTETIRSVRFMDEKAYVVTFRLVDPLFAIDLSNPSTPSVEGVLKIPGFSSYLQPIGEDYLVGIGRDANEITGRVGPAQLTLFYVGDLSNPIVVDQVTMEGARWTSSEAWQDHHAVSYFAEEQILTMPLNWTEEVAKDKDGDGIAEWWGSERYSAIWAFEIDVDGQGGGSLEVAGTVEHEGHARRSLRIGNQLITISDEYLKTHDLHNIQEQNGELYLGPRAVADQFTIQEDSGTNVLNVLENDHLAPTSQPSSITKVTQPIAGYGSVGFLSLASNVISNDGEVAGMVEISPDGQSLKFTPAEDFYGMATFTYTLHDELFGEEQVTVSVSVENSEDHPEAVDDHLQIAVDSQSTVVDVLANDENPDHQSHRTPFTHVLAIDTSDVLFTPDVRELNLNGMQNGMTVTEIGSTNHGGTVELSAWGHIVYTPAAGFEGLETFTYTISNSAGLTDTGVVTIQVGEAPSVFSNFARLGLPSTENTAGNSSFREANAARELAAEAVPLQLANDIDDLLALELSQTPGRASKLQVTDDAFSNFTAEASPSRHMAIDGASELAIDWSLSRSGL